MYGLKTTMTNEKLLQVEIERASDDCPFKNEKISIELNKGECFWLKGPSGAGKTSIASHLAEIANLRGALVSMDWGQALAEGERPTGILFQQGVLIDSLNLKENISLSCRLANKPHDEKAITALLSSVELKEEDGLKMPNELSGGMLRRAALALIFAQEKKLIILDEPFVGLDLNTTQEIIKVIQNLQKKGVAFILISHQEEYCNQVVTAEKNVVLEPSPYKVKEHKNRPPRWNIFVRTWLKVFDYLGISIPLIICAFFAAGFATSMLFAQMLKDTDINTIMGQFHSDHTSFLFRLFGNEFAKVAARYLPAVREKIYALTMAKGFVIELGPLLTGLLLAGRIGGSYAGEVGMMQATNQNKLLTTLGKDPRRWSLLPSAVAAFIAAPVLTVIGTIISLLAGGWVAIWDKYNIFPDMPSYWQAIDKSVFTYTTFWQYSPVVNIYRSIGFMAIILVVAEVAGRFRRDMQPRDVPKSITWAVVFASLLIIMCDWLFSQIYHM